MHQHRPGGPGGREAGSRKELNIRPGIPHFSNRGFREHQKVHEGLHRVAIHAYLETHLD